ncbi:hypothetical protein BX600DRAFT_241154 [Xylariales sp. PMI_506]|nr:hypothetical protein BX600DRAFT_241154 [Xylariales sp. PMI_506]
MIGAQGSLVITLFCFIFIFTFTLVDCCSFVFHVACYTREMPSCQSCSSCATRSTVTCSGKRRSAWMEEFMVGCLGGGERGRGGSDQGKVNGCDIHRDLHVAVAEEQS